MSTLLLLPLLLTAGSAPDDAEFLDLLTPLAGTAPAQWRVIWTEHPATEAIISWSTAESGRRHRVRYAARTDDGQAKGEYDQVARSHRDGRYTRNESDESPEAYYHHAQLTQLEPATTYRFLIESDAEVSRELTFTTAADDDRPFSMLVGGDSRSGWRARCTLNLRIAALVAEDTSLLALSHGGDYVFSGRRWDHWTKWLSHQELTTTASGHVLPIIPTRGNHDAGPLYDEIFDAPGGVGLGYYRTRLGDSVSLLTLNTNIPAAGEQLGWLERELEAAADDSRWILASYHAALYPAVKGPAPARAFWPPLFDQFGVDLVLESDGHCIKRTVPIRADEPHPEGVVYIGEGGLGVPQRKPRTDRWYLQEPGFVDKGHHVIRLDFAPDALRAGFLRMPKPRPVLSADDFVAVIPQGARWSYLLGSTPADGWTAPDFDVSAWYVGEAGFGYGDDDDQTVLGDMRGNTAQLFLRHTFDGQALAETDALNLMCRYDDAFVAYLNGVEIVRVGVTEPTKPGRAPRIKTHEASELESFPLQGWREHVREGTNVLAIVGYNRMRNDSDFTLDPWLAGERLERDGPELPELEAIDDVTLAPRER
jgi:hypothetical protein